MSASPLAANLDMATVGNKGLEAEQGSVLILQGVLSYMEKPQRSHSLSAVLQVPFISLNTSSFQPIT